MILSQPATLTFFLFETWLRNGYVSAFSELCRPNYTFLNSPRLSGRGGVLAVNKNHLNCAFISVEKPSSFEVLMFKIKLDIPLCCIIYLSPPLNQIVSFLGNFLISSPLSFFVMITLYWLVISISMLIILTTNF